jgi:hypothetical protein
VVLSGIPLIAKQGISHLLDKTAMAPIDHISPVLGMWGGDALPTMGMRRGARLTSGLVRTRNRFRFRWSLDVTKTTDSRIPGEKFCDYLRGEVEADWPMHA